jgi:hypothetical protein
LCDLLDLHHGFRHFLNPARLHAMGSNVLSAQGDDTGAKSAVPDGNAIAHG